MTLHEMRNPLLASVSSPPDVDYGDAPGEPDMDYQDDDFFPNETERKHSNASQSKDNASEPPRKRGRKPFPDAAQRRKAQNRAAQKSFRERKLARERDLQDRASRYDELHAYATSQITRLAQECNEARRSTNRPEHIIQNLLNHSSLTPVVSSGSSSSSAGSDHGFVANSHPAIRETSSLIQSPTDSTFSSDSLNEALAHPTWPSASATQSQLTLPFQPAPVQPRHQQHEQTDITSQPRLLQPSPQPAHVSEVSPLQWASQMMLGQVDAGAREWPSLRPTPANITTNSSSSLSALGVSSYDPFLPPSDIGGYITRPPTAGPSHLSDGFTESTSSLDSRLSAFHDPQLPHQ